MEFCDSNEILPPNWIKKGSKSHPDKFYFHNTVTKKSVWKLSDLPLQPTNKEKSKVTTPNKQFTSLSHGSKTIKKNLAENRLSKLNTVLSKEVIEEIKKDQRKLSQNNGTTSEKPRSGQKCNVSSSLPRDFIYKKPVAKKNLSQQRLDFIKSAVDSAEPEQSQVTSSAKRKSEPSVNNDVFLPKRLTTIKDSPEIITSNRTATSSYNKDNSPKKSVASNYSKDSSNFNTSDRSTTSSHNKNSSSSKRLVASNYNKNNYDNFTPKRSETSSNDTDNSARKILHSSKKSVQDRLNMNSDVLMLDVSRDITTEETDDKMDWEEIPVEKIVETVQNVRNNTDSSCMSSNDVIRTSHRNIQHSEDHFYCVIDTNVFLSNLDFIKSLIGRNFHNIGSAVIYVPYMVLNELDKIKSYDDNLARLARRAIKAINDNLKSKSTNFCAQSATEQMKIIQIECGDDLILNACLQINKITSKVLLLSNDTNLRNKAHANRISCMSKDEIVDTKFNSTNKIKFE